MGIKEGRGKACKNKMKPEGEKCAAKNEATDVFCGLSSFITIAWNKLGITQSPLTLLPQSS